MFDLPKYGDGICLARMAGLLEALAIDRARLQRISVVVTGSNGKGSSAAMCAQIGRAYGLRTGLFTSPHLFRFNERIQIDGTDINDDALDRLKRQVDTAIAGVSKRLGEKFGAFEALFALACLHFQESGCDFAVFEAGIGGRYDPVRLIGAHETCVTSVDYEHVELLGNSLELIVSDKSDACAAGGTIVYGENCRGLRPHLIEYNRSRGVTALFVRDQIGISHESSSPSGQRFDFKFRDYDFSLLETGLLGTFQFNNAAIATALFLLWLGRTRPGEAAAKIEAAVRSGLRDVSWPGRLEIIQQDPLTIIDVGHTPDAIQQSLVVRVLKNANTQVVGKICFDPLHSSFVVRDLAPRAPELNTSPQHFLQLHSEPAGLPAFLFRHRAGVSNKMRQALLLRHTAQFRGIVTLTPIRHHHTRIVRWNHFPYFFVAVLRADLEDGRFFCFKHHQLRRLASRAPSGVVSMHRRCLLYVRPQLFIRPAYCCFRSFHGVLSQRIDSFHPLDPVGNISIQPRGTGAIPEHRARRDAQDLRPGLNRLF